MLKIELSLQKDYTTKLATTPAEMEEWLIPLKEAGVDIFHCSQRRLWEPAFKGSDLNFAGEAKKIKEGKLEALSNFSAGSMNVLY